MTVLMIVAGIVVLAVVVGAIWYVVTRGPNAVLVTQDDFDDAYEGDGKSAWEDFHTWQVENEARRRSWEEPEDV